MCIRGYGTSIQPAATKPKRNLLGRKIIIVVILLLIISLPTLAFIGSAEEGKESCESCHSVTIQDGDYILQEPFFWIDAPARVSPNESFKLTLTIIHYGLYEIKDLKAEMVLSNVAKVELLAGEDGVKNLQKIDNEVQTQRLVWNLKTGNTTGNATIPIYINYTLEHIHNTVDDADTYKYQAANWHLLEIKNTPLKLNTWTIMAKPEEAQTFYIVITAKSNIYNLEIVPGRSVMEFTTVSPSRVGKLAGGNDKNITITIQPDLVFDHGGIVIIWSTDEEGTEMDSVQVRVSVSQKAVPTPATTKSGTGTWLWGRISGFVAFALLVLLIPTGGTFKSISRKFDRLVGGAKKRVTLHCAVSYQMFAVALLHVALLMYGHYSSLVWNGVFLVATLEAPFINLGTVTIIIMVIIAILGIFQKQVGKKLGHKNWKRIHGWLTFTALGLIIVHLLLVGTTLGGPIRAMF